MTRDEIRQLIPALYWTAVQETKETNSTRTKGRTTAKTLKAKAKIASEILRQLGFSEGEIRQTLAEM